MTDLGARQPQERCKFLQPRAENGLHSPRDRSIQLPSEKVHGALDEAGLVGRVGVGRLRVTWGELRTILARRRPHETQKRIDFLFP